jgi:hypothetical protein
LRSKSHDVVLSTRLHSYDLTTFSSRLVILAWVGALTEAALAFSSSEPEARVPGGRIRRRSSSLA